MPTSHARDSESAADGDIVAALLAGDLSALGHAYDRYSRHLFTYANGMLHNADTAADVVHDALLIASQRISQLRDPDRFRPWLYAIVRSECLRHLRRGRRSVPLADDFDLAADDSPEHTVGERDLQALVAAAAAGLSPKDREVLELSIRHDLDNAQVAAVLGVGMNQASTPYLAGAQPARTVAVGAARRAGTRQRMPRPRRSAGVLGWRIHPAVA